jgi:hypothetical protein
MSHCRIHRKIRIRGKYIECKVRKYLAYSQDSKKPSVVKLESTKEMGKEMGGADCGHPL